jgi:hypothetical protein
MREVCKPGLANDEKRSGGRCSVDLECYFALFRSFDLQNLQFVLGGSYPNFYNRSKWSQKLLALATLALGGVLNFMYELFYFLLNIYRLYFPLCL